MSNVEDEAERREQGRKYPIVVVAPDPAWPSRFEAEARFLRETLGEAIVLRCEHFGSTAVPGLAAKDVIDILVEVPSFDVAQGAMREILEPLGYAYVWQGAQAPGHVNFYKGYGPEGYLRGVQIFHLHVAPAGHPVWERLAFRDALRGDPALAAEYAELKARLAARHRNDREAYTEAKADFVTRATDAAKGNRGGSGASNVRPG